VDFSRRWGALGMSDLLANAASLLPRAAISCGSSVVSYWEHTSLMNMRTVLPNVVVTVLKSLSVVSVCNLSFAYVCHVARLNRRVLSNVFSFCVRSSPSKTGRAHCVGDQLCHLDALDSWIPYLQKIFEIPCG